MHCLYEVVVRQLQGTGVAPAAWDHFVRVVGRCGDDDGPGVRGQGLVQSGRVQLAGLTCGFCRSR